MYGNRTNGRAKLSFSTFLKRLNFTDVIVGGVLGADAKPDDVLLVDRRRNHVKTSGSVDRGKQLLVQLVGTSKPEADEAKLERSKLEAKFLFCQNCC